MAHYAVSIIALSIVGSVSAFSQTPSTNPEPTPSPTVKRRTFDQFDLSNGIRIGSSSVVSTPAVTEPVDRATYDGIERMVKYASQIETEYRSSEGVLIDPSDHFEPYRVLSRKLPALYRIMEMFRAGLLDQAKMTNPANLALLKQNQQILAEMQMIVNSSDAQLARNQPKLLPKLNGTDLQPPRLRRDRC